MRTGATRRRLAWVATTFIAGLLAALALAQPAAAHAAQPPAHQTIVLFAVPGLQWADVEAMPGLTALAAHSSVGELSVKTRGGVTRCAAGLLAVSAGNRTESPTIGCYVDLSTWPNLVDLNRHSRYDAHLGALGTALQASGITTVAVRGDAVPLLANQAGQVDRVAATVRSGITSGSVVGIVDKRLYRVPGLERPVARDVVDAKITKVEHDLPPGAILMVAGVSDLSGGHAQLHAFVISGPAWTHTELRSSAAGKAPFVQLIDIAPTILAAEGIPIPSYIVGRPMQRSGTVPPSIASYVDDDRHAVDQRTLGQHVFLTIGIAAIIMMLLAAAPWQRSRDVARWLARLIAPAPAMIFLANAFPWWRWSQAAYGGIVLAGCVLLAAATTVAARRNRTAGLLVVPIFSFTVLGLDQLLGAPLQLSAPLGDSPLIAGRFSGMGNLDFAVMATSALLVGGVLGGRLSRVSAVITATGFAGAAVVIDGAPPLGNDIGGVLTLVPAALVLVGLVAQVRMTKRRALAVAVTTVAVAVAVAIADYSRPATDQTHVGRFVGQVLHGGASTEVRRKLDAAIASLGWTIGTFVVVIAVVLAVLTRTRIRRALAASSGAAAGAVAVTVVAVLGAALNDSGITVSAMAAIVAVSALYGGGLRAAWASDPGTSPRPPPSAAPG